MYDYRKLVPEQHADLVRQRVARGFPPHSPPPPNYIHYRSVKHRCTKSPYDWTTTSVHWYLEYFGRDWLRDIWMRCPIKAYGKGWDDL